MQLDSLKFSFSLWNKIIDCGLGFFSPQICKTCRNIFTRYAEGISCQHCWNNFVVAQEKYSIVCERCGDLKLLDNVRSQGIVICQQCEGMSYIKARSCGPYIGALRDNIIFMKRYPYFSQVLKQILTNTINTNLDFFSAADLIIPIPLAKQRERSRGYNQAQIIADSINVSTKIQIDSQSLVRAVETNYHRSGMDFFTRLNSVKSAFKVIYPRLIKGRSIILVDDIYTSGATMETCSKVLLKAGARSIYVFTLARTMRCAW